MELKDKVSIRLKKKVIHAGKQLYVWPRIQFTMSSKHIRKDFKAQNKPPLNSVSKGVSRG